MVDSDSLLEGFTAGAFAFIGVFTVVYCIYRKRRPFTPNLKTSPSMEQLNELDSDPQTIQQQV